jgi:hypothetical protein
MVVVVQEVLPNPSDAPAAPRRALVLSKSAGSETVGEGGAEEDGDAPVEYEGSSSDSGELGAGEKRPDAGAAAIRDGPATGEGGSGVAMRDAAREASCEVSTARFVEPTSALIREIPPIGRAARRR